MSGSWRATLLVFLAFVAACLVVQRPWRRSSEAEGVRDGLDLGKFLAWTGAMSTTTFVAWPLISGARIPWLMPMLAYEVVRMGPFVGRARVRQWVDSPNWPYSAICLGCGIGVLLRIYL